MVKEKTSPIEILGNGLELLLTICMLRDGKYIKRF
jgi:hypothetical protein